MGFSAFGTIAAAGQSAAIQPKKTVAQAIMEQGFQQYMEEAYQKRMEEKARQIVLSELGLDEDELVRRKDSMTMTDYADLLRRIQERIKQKIEEMVREKVGGPEEKARQEKLWDL